MASRFEENGLVKSASNGGAPLQIATTPAPPVPLLSHLRSRSFGEGATSTNPLRKGLPKRIASLSHLLEQFVVDLGGSTPIYSVLVANNGLAAAKFMRSVRSWAGQTLGSSKAISLVAMATPDDIRINAEHLQMADQFVEVPGGTNNNNYANVRLIVQIAERAGVDAVWPGWGHASENPELPAALAERHIRFLGPPAAPMAALGDKIGSTILAQAAGVPTLPWSGSGVAVSFDQCPAGVVPEDIYAAACIHSVEEALTACRNIGYPVMLKASWGGGGKGIRKVMGDDDVKLYFKQIQGEVPGSPIFAMKLAPISRHLEVQLLCDEHGNVASLLSRDCSVQRRHQKIVEEGPATVASQETLRAMEACARALAKSVCYVGAATVEFLYVVEEQQYYFLELNPRLQVEHPVTEGITNTNLPATQLMIGMGIPLYRIPALRSLFCQDPKGEAPFDFDTTQQRTAEGHLVAVRITSEDANDGFKPTCGRIDELHLRPTPEVWGYFSVKSGGGIHEFSDSQFGHLFAKAETRGQAIRAMVVALKDLVIRGEIRTTVDYSLDMLCSPDFVNNKLHTGWLDARIASRIRAGAVPWYLAVIAGAVVKAVGYVASQAAEYMGYLTKGQLPPANISTVHFKDELVIDGVKYKVAVARRGLNTYNVCVNSSPPTVDVITRQMADGGFLMQVDGESHVVHVEEESLGTRLLLDSLPVLLAKEADPSRLVASSPGKLVRHLVPSGSTITSHQAFAELEVMKMMMPLLSPAAGRITFVVPEGGVLAAGELIARLELQDADAVVVAKPFDGLLPELGPPQIASDRLDHKFKAAYEGSQAIMAGFDYPVDVVVADLVQCIDSPALAMLTWNEAAAVVSSRLPSKLAARLQVIASAHEQDVANYEVAVGRLASISPCEFPARAFLDAMHNAQQEAAASEKAALTSTLEPLLRLANEHAQGREAFARKAVVGLLDSFLAVEEAFQLSDDATTEQDVVDALRKVHSGNLSAVLALVCSHQGLPRKVDLVQRLMSALILPSPAHYRPHLRRLAQLGGKGTAELTQHARQLLEQSLLGDLRVVVARALSGLDMFSSDGSGSLEGLTSPPLESGDSVVRRSTISEGLFKGLASLAAQGGVRGGGGGVVRGAVTAAVESKMEQLVGAPAAVEDALASLLVDSKDLTLSTRAMITYVRRIYSPALLREPFAQYTEGVLTCLWLFDETALSAAPAATGPPQRVGALLVLRSLAQVGHGLELIADLLRSLDLQQAGQGGTLHVVLAGDEALSRSPEAEALLSTLASDSHSSILADLSIEHMGLTAGESEMLGQAGLGVTQVMGALVSCHSAALRAMSLSIISLLAKGPSALPVRDAYVWDASAAAYKRNRFMRQVEPPEAALLELSKLRSFPQLQYNPSRNLQWHIYSAEERPDTRSYALRRMYVRGVVRQLGHPALLAASYTGNSGAVASAAVQELDDMLGDCLADLNRTYARSAGDQEVAGRPDWTHIFLTVLPPLPLQPGPRDDTRVAIAMRSAAAGLAAKHSSALRTAAVAVVEIRFRGPSRDSSAWRVLIPLPTGHEQGDEHVEVYREVLLGMPPEPATLCYSSAQPASSDTSRFPLHLSPVLGPYPPLQPLQRKRLAARRHKVTYVYDFPAVFEAALRDIWAARAAAGEPASFPPAGHLVEAEEVVLPQLAGGMVNSNFRNPGPMQRVVRPIGSNDCGMVAWLMTLKTPECPQGRQVVAVANDITWQSGAFSPTEDAVFKAAAELSLEERVPLVYLAANSGARVGLANEVREALRVAWNDESDPQRGFQYLYLDDTDYQRLQQQAATASSPILQAERLEVKGSVRWVLSDIIGLEDGLGVECLSGSGSIASAYNRAFREGYTITLVSGRTVGIGAYLARLGRRCVQRCDQPIILTGYAALNKLLARTVYTSHMQLGGPRVMGVNGVSHAIVADDLEGASMVLTMLSYAPPDIGGSGPALLPSADLTSRLLTYVPGLSEKLDPRAAIAGRPISSSAPAANHPDASSVRSQTSSSGGSAMPASTSNSWQSGLFDLGSWTESHASWARTVVTGRARLGGMAVGVIAVESQAVVRHLPADPGMPDSCETNILQAGQVWYPDSADKTASAMEEFDLEQLPLFILANWRGFSGGQRDLFDGVLQAGSLIVERLRTYRQPVFVYIPAGAELRGGAWVVVDSEINPSQVEMYADPSARGGVLEPEGVVEIKFRTPDLLRMMHRIDPQLASLKASAGSTLLPVTAASNEVAIKARERLLLPIYAQVARMFADMHDTPVRMLSKGVLHGVVPWAHSRRFFAVRLRRRLVEEQLLRHISSADPALTRRTAIPVIQAWYDGASCPAWQVTSPDRSSSKANGYTAFGSGDHGLGAACASGQHDGRVDNTHSHDDLSSRFEAMMCADRSFLDWAESHAGRSTIAGELKSVRSEAAAAMISQVLGSAEGKEGMLKALQSAVRQDGVLGLQLKMLLNEMA